jgi:hypothetical protein
MLELKRIQYSAIRIILGLMKSTPNKSLGVLSGIPPFQFKIKYLNFKLVGVFRKIGHPLKEKLTVL